MRCVGCRWSRAVPLPLCVTLAARMNLLGTSGLVSRAGTRLGKPLVNVAVRPGAGPAAAAEIALPSSRSRKNTMRVAGRSRGLCASFRDVEDACLQRGFVGCGPARLPTTASPRSSRSLDTLDFHPLRRSPVVQCWTRVPSGMARIIATKAGGNLNHRSTAYRNSRSTE
jgi:hypothetical protein